MRAFLFFLLGNIFLGTLDLCAQENRNVLLFTKTAGFRHSSIPKGVAVVDSLLKKEGICVTHSEDSNYFNSDSLARFDAVIFLNTSGDLFDAVQKESFKAFIRSGKGFVGIHAASDTEHNWHWYGQLVGGYFASHPAVQDAEIQVLDSSHQSTTHLKRLWFHRDEWYDFKNIKSGLNVLMMLNELTYTGGQMGKFHPVAWFQEFDGGRSFYSALGHTDESYDSENFQKHIVGGVIYALGASN